MHYYQGAKDQERKVRTKLKTEEIIHFEGARNEERYTCVEFPNGAKAYFASAMGSAQLVRVKMANGQHWCVEEIQDAPPEAKTETCVVCLEAPATWAGVVCGHLCICTACKDKLPISNVDECPFCRTKGGFVFIRRP